MLKEVTTPYVTVFIVALSSNRSYLVFLCPSAHSDNKFQFTPGSPACTQPLFLIIAQRASTLEKEETRREIARKQNVRTCTPNLVTITRIVDFVRRAIRLPAIRSFLYLLVFRGRIMYHNTTAATPSR